MIFNFRKVAAAMSSAVMMSSTVALAAAANYPAPFVSGGAANVAVVYGSNAASTDLVAVADISSNLQAKLAAQTATGGTVTASGGSIVGETYPLFTGSSKLFLNASLKSVRETLTDSELPTILADGSFEGDVSATFEQRITMGENPKINFAAQPTDSDDPIVEVELGTTGSTQYVYNASIIFDEAVNFTHADSHGTDFTMFGQKFSASSSTTTTKLILFKSSETLFLDSVSNPSETVTIDAKEYTVELISATDTSAEIKITDSDGNSEQKEITEDTSKKVNGIEVSVDSADESTALSKITASIIVGASKLTLQDGVQVKQGSDDDLIDGTTVSFRDGSDVSTTYPGAIGKLIFQVAAGDNTKDSIPSGGSFVDPIFGTFKVEFAGLNIERDSTTRELITVQSSSNDKMTVTFESHDGSEAKTVYWINNQTKSIGGGQQLADAEADDIFVGEGKLVNQSSYVVLGNEETGGIFEITSITNVSSTSASDDSITLKNLMTGESNTYKASSEGTVTPSLLGNAYTIKYYGAATDSGSKAMQATFNFDTDSTGNDVVLFPTIETSKGAKLAFYEPTTINVYDWIAGPTDLTGLSNASNVTNFKFPDGDGYTSIAVMGTPGNEQLGNISINGLDMNTEIDELGSNSTAFSIGKLSYNVTAINVTGAVTVYLRDVGGANIENPAIILFEEKDDQSVYEAIIIDSDGGYDGGTSADLGVADAERTWENDASTGLGNEIQLNSNDDVYEDISYWGTINTLDKSDSNDFKVTLNYPADQVYAQVYVAEIGASITAASASGGGTVSELGSVTVSDSEVSSVSGKNLIVVGGSCVNSVAAGLVGGSLCGAAWETGTGVGSGSFLIETYDRGSGKVATLVAGYNAGDTTNAAKALTTQTVDTSVGKKYTGSTATSISLVGATATA